MTETAAQSFAYQAQTDDGQRMTGIVDAPDVQVATQRLNSLRLRVLEIQPAQAPKRPRSMRGEDFMAFNLQLAQLTKAGLPIERGLRLIAGDLRRGRLSRTVGQIASELESGTPLAQAFEKHRAQFPTLYGRLVEAGVRGGNLPGVLLSLGRHLETEQRLRSVLWRTFSYPAMVFCGLALIVGFLGYNVIPRFEQLYRDMRVQLPVVTEALLTISHALPYIAIIVIGIFLAAPIIWGLLRAAGKDRAVADALLLPLPLIGPVLRASLMARWLDAARIAVDAGLDLPAAAALAGDAAGSPALRRDSQALSDNLQAARPLTAAKTEILPATVPAAIEFASGHNDLPATLDALSDLYRRQADLRVDIVPTVLTPLLVILIAITVGFVLAGLFLPMVNYLNAISGH
jgi:type IV pilus assembly protein PilC